MAERTLARRVIGRYPTLHAFPDWKETESGDSLYLPFGYQEGASCEEKISAMRQFDLWQFSIYQAARRRGYRCKSQVEGHGRRMWLYKKRASVPLEVSVPAPSTPPYVGFSLTISASVIEAMKSTVRELCAREDVIREEKTRLQQKIKAGITILESYRDDE